MASLTPSEAKYDQQKPLLFYGLTAIGFFVLLIFGIRAFFAQEEITGTIELTVALLTIITMVFYYLTGSLLWAARIVQVLLLAVLLSISRIEKSAYTGIMLWFYTLPLLAIYLSGVLEGLLWSSATLVVVIALMASGHAGSNAAGHADIYLFRFMCVYIVITAMTFIFEKHRSKAQNSLDISEEELIKRNDELRMLLSSISEVVFSIDLRGTLIKIFQPYDHGEFIDLPEEFIGRPYRDVLPEQLVCGLEHAIGQLNQNDKPTAFTYAIGDGPQAAWFLAKIAVMKNPDGAARGYTVIARNITEQKQEEGKRKALEEDLVRSEQKAIMGRIAAGIAHEINNPASAITSDLSTLNVLIDRFPDNKEKAEIMEIIRRDHAAIDRITSIVSAVKGAYRPQKWHCIDLSEEIELQLTLLHKEYKDRITIEREYGDIPNVEAYGSEVGQIILNVLKNAVDAIENTGTITIRTKEINGRVSIAIIDTGKGIPENELPHIFEPFFTTKEVGKGTGLGLSISYSNALHHEGILYVDATAPGRGTTFILELPVKRGNDETL